MHRTHRPIRARILEFRCACALRLAAGVRGAARCFVPAAGACSPAAGERERDAGARARCGSTLTAPADLAEVDDDDDRGPRHRRARRTRACSSTASRRTSRRRVHRRPWRSRRAPTSSTSRPARPRHPAAMTAVRVTRLVPVEVPDVAACRPRTPSTQLEGLGLEAEVARRRRPDRRRCCPATVGVCGTDPGAGDRSAPAATVVAAGRRRPARLGGRRGDQADAHAAALLDDAEHEARRRTARAPRRRTV